MNLQESLDSFLQNEDMHCFLVRGQWGVGKTFAVDEWTRKFDNNKCVEVIKLPLFGISSVNELNSLALNSSSLLNKFIDYFKKINQDITVGAGPVNISFPLIGMIANLLKRNYPKNKKKKFVFVIDDIERKDFNLTIEELFGFVDQLPIANTKVILISNTDKLFKESDILAFNLFKEKVIQSEFFIDSPQESVVKTVAGEELFEIIKKHLHFVKNLRTIIKLKNILSSVGNVNDLVKECAYLCLLSIDECVFSRDRLKEIYIEEQKHSEKLFSYSFDKMPTRLEIESKVDERISEIKNDCDVFYENIKCQNILSHFPQDSLKEIITKIYKCIADTKYDELKEIKIHPVDPFKKINVSWDTVFYSSSPTIEYSKALEDIKNMFGDSNYDQVKVFTTYYVIRINCDNYIKRTENIKKLEKAVETKCISPVSEALLNGDYQDKHDGLNSQIFSSIPIFLEKIENAIFTNCVKRMNGRIRTKLESGDLNIEYVVKCCEKMRNIAGNDSILKEFDWDSILLCRVKQIFILFSKNAETIWHEAHETFRWIYDYKEKYQLKKTIKFIISNSHGTNIKSKRLSFFSKYYRLENE